MNKTGIEISLLVLIFLSSLIFNVQPAKAIDYVYIRADGSVDPPSTPISNVGNSYYTFTANIYDIYGIWVERDNIVVDGAGHMVEGPGYGHGIFVADRSNVTIKSITIEEFDYGIALYSSSGNTISANTIRTNSEYGVGLFSSSGNSISANTVTNNQVGILLSSSNYNSISGNTFTDDGLHVVNSYSNSVENNTVNGRPLVYLEGAADYSVGDAGQVVLVRCDRIRVENLTLSRAGYGVELREARNCIISGNTITANSFYGIRLYDSTGNTISANIMTDNGWYGVELASSSDNSISGNTITNGIGNGIGLHYSSYNSISGNTLTNNGYGILLYSSSDNSISGNTIPDNGYGIRLLSSSNYNSISENILTNNGYGIWLNQSSNNLIRHNDFVGNSAQAETTVGFVNIWDGGYPSGGNYWSDYVGVDSKSGPNQDQPGNDGIGDTPYVIDSNNTDLYPLMHPAIAGNVTISPGVNVTVSPTTGLTLTFDNVESAGYVTAQDTLTPSAPALANLVGKYCDIAVTAEYSGNVMIRLAYDDTDMTLDRESTLQMMQYTPLVGDIVDYGQVNIMDIALIAASFGTTPTSPGWNAIADINGDGNINILDISICALNFGKTAEWTNITTYVDTELNVVYGETAHFSIIGIH